MVALTAAACDNPNLGHVLEHLSVGGGIAVLGACAVAVAFFWRVLS